jgi:hypothetical protein
MTKKLILLLAVGLASQLAQASSLTTSFGGGNRNSSGGVVNFDLNVLAGGGITVTSLSVNATNQSLGSITGSSIQIDIYARIGTVSGNETSSVGWTLVSSGTGTAAARNTESVIDVSDFYLAAGVTGIAIHNVNFAQEYTNGSDGFSNADLTFTPFSAQNGLFSSNFNSPRQWNGTVTYDLGGGKSAVPEPSTLGLSLLALGAGVAIRRRKK